MLLVKKTILVSTFASTTTKYGWHNDERLEMFWLLFDYVDKLKYGKCLKTPFASAKRFFIQAQTNSLPPTPNRYTFIINDIHQTSRDNFSPLLSRSISMIRLHQYLNLHLEINMNKVDLRCVGADLKREDREFKLQMNSLINYGMLVSKRQKI